MLAAHINVTYGKDDISFRAVLDYTDAAAYLAKRWNTWTSRVIIEGVMIHILDIDRFPLWKLLNCLLFLPLAWSVSRLSKKEAGPCMDASYNWFITGLVLLYPYGYDMSTAGWASTTMNYFWPLVFGLMSIVPIRKLAGHEPLKWYDYAITVPLFLYAANAEQACVLLSAIYGVFFVWQLAVNKSFHPFFPAMLLLSMISIGIILKAPGNSLRGSAELRRFMDYPMLTFCDKLDLALSSSLSQLICKPSLLFLFFSLMLAAAVWVKYPDVLFRLVAAFPAACQLIFGIFAETAKAACPDLALLTEMTGQGVITTENYILYKSYLPLYVMGGVVVCTLVSFYLIYHDDRPRTGLLSAFIFLLGLASRAMMAFSPTVWASNTRTGIYLNYSVIFLCCFLYIQLENKRQTQNFLKWLLGILSVFSYLVQFSVM